MRLPRGVLRAAMRSRRRLPAATWPTLLQLASLVPSELPVIGPPTARRVLVVAPHPDDETIGCGGTLALLADAGAEVVVVVATDGEATIGSPHTVAGTAARRRAEATVACELLGLAAPAFLGLPDGGLDDHVDELRRALADARAALDPDLVLSPWPLDRHPDHRRCAAVVGELADDMAEVWGYEAHVPLTPTRAVDVSSVVDRKRAALAAHETAGLAMDLEATLGLNRWRSLPVTGGAGWTEAFLALPGGAWREAVALAAEVRPSVSALPAPVGRRRPSTGPAPGPRA